MSIYKEFVEAFMPDGMLKYFELVSFETVKDELHVFLEERDEIPQEYKSIHHRANGFLSEIKIRDFPIRDKFVVLHVKKRRWLLVEENKKVTRDWQLTAQGTRLTPEFSAFLKELS